MKLLKIPKEQIQTLFEGKLTYIKHPKKGYCKAYSDNIYIGYKELTEEEKLQVQQL